MEKIKNSEIRKKNLVLVYLENIMHMSPDKSPFTILELNRTTLDPIVKRKSLDLSSIGLDRSSVTKTDVE